MEPSPKLGWFREWLWKKRPKARFFLQFKVAFPKAEFLGKSLMDRP
jgi:hypothetical protein